MKSQNCFFCACTESVRAQVRFNWNVWNRLEATKTKLVYLFIAQPEVKFVSISAIACELGIEEKDVCIALFEILNKGVK